METKKLYRDDPYKTETEAQILGIENQVIELDQTVFFAEAGGQVGDTGSIQNVPIVDAQHIGGMLLLRQDAPTIKIRTRILHSPNMQAFDLSIGDIVQVKIDWQRRYRIMQMHTAGHLVFHYALKLFGPDGLGKLSGGLKGCRIAEDIARFDFPAHSALSSEDLLRISEATNEMLAKSIPINYKIDSEEPDLRYWICGDIEMYCGGTHVRNTNEIQGEVILKRQKKGAGLERIYWELIHG